MESRYIAFTITVLLSMLVFAKESHAHGQITDEDYWKAVWPNTTIPNPLQDLITRITSGTEKYDQLKLNDTQYPIGFFFNHEIYPGKTMIIKLGRNWAPMPWDDWDDNGVKSIGSENYEGYTYQEACEQKISSVEDKYCAESLRSLIDYVISKLGKNVKPLLSSFKSKQDQYRVEGVTNIGQKSVMCHRLNFQKVTFYCHEVHGTTVYRVPLVAGDGTKTQVLAVCHFDTSGMNKKWIRQVMKVDPGTTPVCHFLGNNEVVWIPN